MRFITFSLLLLCFFSGDLLAQSGDLSPADRDSMAAQEKGLMELSYIMHTDSSSGQRFQACKELIQGLVGSLKTPNSFQFPFDSLRGVVVKTSPDSSFRIFTWELHVNADQYRHYGAIQRNTEQLALIPLIDRSDSLRQNPENAVLTPDQWLGYVVYDLVPAGRYQGEPIYFLFGFDRYGRWQRRKILDVLTFDRNGKPVFGVPVFDTYNEHDELLVDRKRIILDYGAEANVVLRYEPYGNKVMYENLIMAPGPEAAGPVSMPDGSYHSLELNERGRWVEEKKVFKHKYKEAPTGLGVPTSATIKRYPKPEEQQKGGGSK